MESLLILFIAILIWSMLGLCAFSLILDTGKLFNKPVPLWLGCVLSGPVIWITLLVSYIISIFDKHKKR